MGVEGEHRTRHLTRRGLLTGGVAVAGGLLIGDGLRRMIAYRDKRDEQLEKARRMAEAQGKTQPTQEELNTATQLRNEIIKNPLAKQNPDAVQQARTIFEKQEDFNKAYGQVFYEIRAEEGASDSQYFVGGSEFAGGLAVVGLSPVLPEILKL